MLQKRVIPVLLFKGEGLVKGVQFKNHQYVGDPINAVQIFNAHDVDEILFLDITATAEGRIPDPQMIQRIADQCLFPFGVGGGIRTLDDARKILSSGAEKVCLNTYAFENPKLITEIAEIYGSQSVVVCIDVEKSFFGKYQVKTRSGKSNTKLSPVEAAKLVEKYGAGEIVIQSIDKDGQCEGYDIDLIRQVADAVKIPVIAVGGAGNLDHMKVAVKEGHASAVAAGSMFVFHGRRKAVLVNYPEPAALAAFHEETE